MTGGGEMNDFRLDDRVAVVTGAAGRIGRAIATAIVAAGARTVAVDRAGATVPADTIAEIHDLTETDGLAAWIGDLDARTGGIDIWINCAYPRSDDWGSAGAETDPASWRANVEWQLNGVCLMADAIAHRMADRRRGSIINIASIYGVVAPDFSIYAGTEMSVPGAYAAIKGGLIAYTRLLASRHGGAGVRVNALCPGGVAADQPQSFVDAYAARTPLGRMATPEDIAGPAVFLASEAARYITGTALMVDGGWTAL